MPKILSGGEDRAPPATHHAADGAWRTPICLYISSIYAQMRSHLSVELTREIRLRYAATSWMRAQQGRAESSSREFEPGMPVEEHRMTHLPDPLYRRIGNEILRRMTEG